jgi:hypothetical protein
MNSTAPSRSLNPASDQLDIADVERRVKAVFIGSIGNPGIGDAPARMSARHDRRG